MKSPDSIARLRKKVAYTKGLRNLAAKAELAEALIHMNSMQEAGDLAQEAVEQARTLHARAIGRGVEDRDYRKALAQCLFAFGACRDYERRYQDSESALRQSAALFEQLEEWPAYVKSTRLLSDALVNLQRIDEAIRTLDRCIDFCRQMHLSRYLSALLSAKANALLTTSEIQTARVCLEEAIEAAEGRAADKAHALHAYAYCFHSANDPATAEQHFSEALRLWRTVDNKFSLMSTLRLAAINRRTMGDSPGAIAYLDEAIEIAADTQYTWYEAELRFLSGDVHYSCADLEQAFDHYQNARELFSETGNRSGEVSSLAQMGRICHEIGDVDGGRVLLEECAAKIQGLETGPKHLTAIMTLVRYCPKACDLDGLKRIIEELIRANRQKGPQSQVTRMSALGDILAAQGKYDEAEAAYRECLDTARKINSGYEQGKAMYRIAKLHCLAGKHSEALPLLRRALELNSGAANLALQISICETLATACEANGDPVAALAHLRHKIVLEQRSQTEQNQRRIELLKIRHDVKELEKDKARLQDRVDTLLKTHESDKRLIQVLNARAERDEEVLAELRRKLRMSSQHNERQPDHILPMLRLAEERLNEIESSKDDAELVQLDHSFLAYLAEHFPQLTAKERRVCALIRTNISNSDIARLMSISQRSIETYRYRIRKKLGFEPGSDLNAAIAGLGRDL